MKNDVSSKLLHKIDDSIGYGVCNIFIYYKVSLNFQFPFCFLDITHLMEFMNNFII